MLAEKIREAVAGALGRLGIPDAPFEVSHPENLGHGDFATNAALAAAKTAGMPPRALAERIVAELALPAAVERVAIVGPGFINFTLSRQFLSDSVAAILAGGTGWGSHAALSGKTIIVEYTQPNPFKPFHIGHLMSNAIGESISRLVEAAGATVVRMNYQGDIGPHVAKCLWGIAKEGLDPSSVSDLGKAYVLGNAAYEDDPNAKAAIDNINRRLYQNDPALAPAYQAGRTASLARFEEIYRFLGTRFDHYFFESETGPVGLALVAEGLAKGIFEKSDGAVVYKGERHGLHTRVFVTSHGTPTYEAKELGLSKLKRDAVDFDLNITTIAVEQDGYFTVVTKAIEEVLPELSGKISHVPHGMMLLSTGKMSSRKGNVITGETIIEDVREKARAKMAGREIDADAAEIVDHVAVGAIKYAILKQSTGKNIVFDPETSLSLEGDSGPYIQYAHTRAVSVLAKARAEGINANADTPPAQAYQLERLLYRFPEVAERAAREYEPHFVAGYLVEIAAAFNSFYANEKIADANDPHSPFKVALTEAVALTLRNGLALIGIGAPEKM